jgi:lipid II:glycine glycyltransferase (peptidoglycan interpeptide bridge formation enzyme)
MLTSTSSAGLSAAAAPTGAALSRVDVAAWPALASRFSDRNYRQLAEHDRACGARVGAVSEHVIIRRADELLAAACVRLKRVPLLGGIAYVSGGPLVGRRDAAGAGRFAVALDALVAEYAVRRGFLLRVAPPLGSPAWHAALEAVCAQRGFGLSADAPRYRTFVLDLEPPLEAIRQRLKQKWRNGLNRAEKNAIEVTIGDGLDDFAAFAELFDALRRRKPFAVELDAAFYADVQARLDPADRLHVLLARVDGRLAAGMVVSLIGETAVYLLGATSDIGMESKAAYLLQWRTIVAARERGSRRYDLGGIDPEGNPGVHHFKEGLGGEDIVAPGPFEYAVPGLRRTLTLAAARWYGVLRRRRRRAASGGGSSAS